MLLSLSMYIYITTSNITEYFTKTCTNFNKNISTNIYKKYFMLPFVSSDYDTPLLNNKYSIIQKNDDTML